MNCTSCGASIENTSNKSSYQCEYCSSYNYDEKFIEERFANLNPTKANEIFGVAQVRFQSGRYDEAIDLLTESLKENNDCVEAWGCLAICRVMTLTTGNFDKNVSAIELCMIKIKNLDADNTEEYFIEIHEKLLEQTLKLSKVWINKSTKSYRAYESTQPLKAKSRAGKQILEAVSMIDRAHHVNSEFKEPSIKASIYTLFAIFNINALKNDPAFTKFKLNAQEIVQSALTKNKDSTNQLITNLGLIPSTINSYVNNKSITTTKSSGGGKKWLYIIGGILVFLYLIG
jgi:tetratricopeptide (TPR) repeat protein